LLSEGAAHVISVDNFIPGCTRNLSHLKTDSRFSSITADIAERIPVTQPLDFVFNLASPASPIDYAQLPIETLRAGSIGTENGLRLALPPSPAFLPPPPSQRHAPPPA